MNENEPMACAREKYVTRAMSRLEDTLTFLEETVGRIEPSLASILSDECPRPCDPDAAKDNGNATQLSDRIESFNNRARHIQNVINGILDRVEV